MAEPHAGHMHGSGMFSDWLCLEITFVIRLGGDNCLPSVSNRAGKDTSSFQSARWTSVAIDLRVLYSPASEPQRPCKNNSPSSNRLTVVNSSAGSLRSPLM